MIRADLNEACLPPPSHVLDAVRNASPSTLWRYPGERCDEARFALAARLRVDASNLILGNGADEVITLIMRSRLRPGDNIVTLRPTFGMYARVARSLGVEARAVPYRRRWQPDAGDIVSACDGRTKVIFLGHPNNPTGEALEPALLRSVAQRCPQAFVVVDEVYLCLGERSLSREARGLFNVAVIGSLSKVAALAGIRFGYAVCPSDVAAAVGAIEAPFPVSGLSLEATLAFLKGGEATREFERLLLEQTDRSLQTIVREIGELAANVWASAANFVLMEFSVPGSEIADALRAEGVAVRSFDDPSLRNCVRFCALNDRETDQLVEAFRRISCGPPFDSLCSLRTGCSAVLRLGRLTAPAQDDTLNSTPLTEAAVADNIYAQK